MNPDEIKDMIADLSCDAPRLQEKAEAWLLSHRAEVAERLVEALDEPGWGSTGHWRIMRLVARIAPARALPAVLRRLHHGRQTRDSILIRGAMEALAAIDSSEARQALLEMLDGGNRDHALQAALHLEDCRDPGLIDTFAGLLERPDASMRYIAARALLALNDPRALEIVRRRYVVETDPEVRKLIESADGAPPDG